MALSNSETAPRICRISFDVGPASRKDDGLSAAISVTPRSRSMAKPTSCTMRSRAKRLAVSTMTVRTPLPAIRASAAEKPGRASIGSPPLDGLIGKPIDHVEACALGVALDREPLAPIGIFVVADTFVAEDVRI